MIQKQTEDVQFVLKAIIEATTQSLPASVPSPKPIVRTIAVTPSHGTPITPYSAKKGTFGNLRRNYAQVIQELEETMESNEALQVQLARKNKEFDALRRENIELKRYVKMQHSRAYL